ncbi:MAG: ATP-binding protein [Luteolibacter sp.]
MALGQLASLVWLAYVVDASVRLWRTGSASQRRQSIMVGGSIILFILCAAALPGLVAAGMLEFPMNSSMAFIGMILVMNYELGGDVLNAAQLSQSLKTSEQRLALSTEAAQLGAWEWNINARTLWISAKGRELYGFPASGEIDLEHFLACLDPHDLEQVTLSLNAAVSGSGKFSKEYRIVLPDGSVRWVSTTGKVEKNVREGTALMHGVSRDISQRKLSLSQTEIQRQELAHLSRVSLLGELAGTLAHELNQPLTAILSNSQTGRRGIKVGKSTPAELADILDDIAADAKRAGGIIHGMRAMLKKDSSVDVIPLDPNEIVKQVLVLLHSEIIFRKLDVVLQLDGSLPLVMAGRVEVQQVLINLVINALDAISQKSGKATLRIATGYLEDRVTISVYDSGPGIPPEIVSRLFDPFFSTKQGGLGLGLAISRSIMSNFGGELLADNNPDGGAVFQMRLLTASPPK